MLYDERVKEEIDRELEYILSQNHHYLSGTEEETREELRQARGVAHNIVMQRQEKDLLDMLYEWRARKASQQEGAKPMSELLTEVFNNG